MIRTLLLVLAATIAAPSVAEAQRFVEERVPIWSDPSYAGAAGLAHGDVDGDGADELLVQKSGNLDVILRAGDGPFEPVAIVDSSYDSTLVDLNADGRADLLTRMFTSLGYFPGQPDGSLGTFQPIQAQGSGVVFWSKDAADVNGDGKVDVVASVSTGGTGSSGALRWYLGNGSGGFSAPSAVAAAPYPLEFTLGDYDNDGDVDAVGTEPFGTAARVFWGTGFGFGPPQLVAPAGAAAHRLATGDFDADGVDDLACAPAAASMTWFRGGAGGFTLGGTHALPGATVAVRSLVAADLEGDGDDDILLVESAANDGRVWRGRGTPGAGLSAPTVISDLPCWTVAALEYDGRPGLDLAAIPLSTWWPELWPGDGAGGILAPVDLPIPGGCVDPDSVGAGDLDRDGALDLVFETGFWRRGAGDGTFLPPVATSARVSELVDLNGDGRLDGVGLLHACGSGGVTVALDDGVTLAAVPPPSQPPAGSLKHFAIADLDADGDLDVASAGPGGAFTHRNDGTGSFLPYVALALPAPCSNIAAGDLNGDGLADLARTSFVSPVPQAHLAWGLSNGAGQVVSVQSVSIAPERTDDILIDDLDGDALADVVWTTEDSFLLWGALGDGAGNFGTVKAIALQSGAASLTALASIDVDGDGVRDLVAGDEAGGYVGVSRRGAGGALWPLWRQVRSGGGAGKLLPYDFDADGRLDLAWANANTVRLALSRTFDPAGTAVFGAGTPGCLGRASLGTVEPARIGNADFRLLANHLPPGGTGWFLVGTKGSPAGVDPFGLGLLLHVDPIPPAILVLVPATADAAGQASLALPIPGGATLVGATYVTQVVVGGAGSPGYDCSSSSASYVGSRGLTLTLQP